MKTDPIKDFVKEKYGKAARQAASGAASDCCGSGCGCGTSSSHQGGNPVTSNLYGKTESLHLPAAALQASMGCGNPTALADLHEGETVLDLGSGGGIDVLLSARRVGSAGKAYGVDMTDEMLSLAEENKLDSGLNNVEFLKGEIENIPLPENSVDVIISNCVINLSSDKDRVFAEAFRILKPGGRIAVSDVVFREEVPEEIRRNIELWTGCVAGALTVTEYHEKLAAAGFESIEIEPTRIYHMDDAQEFLSEAGIDVKSVTPGLQGKVFSAFVRAKKPGKIASAGG